MKKKGFRIFPRIVKTKYSWGDIVPVSGVYECSICSNYQAFKKSEHFSQCQDCINSGTQEENRWYVTNELVYFISKNINMEYDKIASAQLKIADAITEFAGTITFFLIHVLWFLLWIIMNLGWLGTSYIFDPFPFGLLTMIVSLEAIFLSTFIMISQNIAAKKAELRAEHEYNVNLETEKNVAEILALIKEIRQENQLKHETIEEIKETVEEISEMHAEEIHAEETSSIEEAPANIEEHIERLEEESFKEQEKILDEAGIDMIEESAPPVILEEKTKKRRGRKKKEKKSDEMQIAQ